MPIGICKLCQTEKDLQRSHLIPKAVYRKTRSNDPKKPHPMVATLKGTRQSSYQVRDYVLCSECEQLFGRQGEDYAMRLIHQGNRFPFLELLNSHGSGLVAGEFRFYSVEMTPTIDRRKLAYFAVSVFWRAAVHTWTQEDGSSVWIDLTDDEKETLRQYLLGNQSFPKESVLLSYACNDVQSQRMFWMPGQNDRTDDRVFLLGVRGMTFFFWVGGAPARSAHYCIMNSQHRWITVRNCIHPRPIWTLGIKSNSKRR
jgi:hypothetical protein